MSQTTATRRPKTVPTRWKTVVFAAAATAFLAPPTLQAQVDTVGLGALRATYLQAYNAGDIDAMASVYAADAVRMPYDAPAQEGRDAILDSYRASFRTRTFDVTLRFDVLDVHVQGTRAVERGRYVEVLSPRNGSGPRREQGKYVVTAVQDDDGHWHYEWTIFNRDGRPTTGPPVPL